MFNLRMVLALVAALSVISCSDKTHIEIGHTLQPTPPAPKPTTDCTDADIAVYGIIKQANPKGFNTTQPIVLNDDVSCAIHVLVNAEAGESAATTVTNVAVAYQATAKSYAFNLYGKGQFPLWYDYPSEVPTKVPTDDDCKFALKTVATAFPNAKTAIITNPRNPQNPTRCYVQATFPDEASFKAFLGYTYPANSGQSDAFHVYHQVSESLVHQVSVYGTEAQN